MIANSYWEAKLPPDFVRPNENTSTNELLFYIKNKYVKKLYVNPNVENPVTLILEGRFDPNQKIANNITNPKKEVINYEIPKLKEEENKKLTPIPETEKFQPTQTSKINEDLINFEFNDNKGSNKGKNISLKIGSENNIISNQALDTRTILDLYKEEGKNINTKGSDPNKYMALERFPMGLKANFNNPIPPSYMPMIGGKISNNFQNNSHCFMNTDPFISKGTSNSNMVNIPFKNVEQTKNVPNGSKNNSKKEGAFDDLLSFV